MSEEIHVKVNELLDGSPFDNLYQVEQAPGANFSRPTVWRWQNRPDEVYRISIFALYRFLRSLGYKHSEVERMPLGSIVELGFYESSFRQ